MNDEIINQAINEAKSTSPVEDAGNQPINQNSDDSQQLQSEPAKDNSTETESETSNASSYKTLQNALARQKRKNERQRDEYRQLRAEIDSLRASMAKGSESQRTSDSQIPQYSNFETFDDYFKAREEYLEKKFSDKFSPSQQATNQSSQQEQPQFSQEQIQQLVRQHQQLENFNKQEAELVKQFPNYNEILESHRDLIEELPQSIKDTFLDIDNAPLAVLTLINEGKLQEFANLSSPGKAAVELERAQKRGEQLLKKRITNTPPPMGGVRGVSRSNNGRITDKSSIDDIMQWLHS